MGVPSFFRWLSRKYPKIISTVIDESNETVDGVQMPLDYSGPNPNGELDNLYIDMNGIVHPCTHPEGRPAPETEDEMMLEVFKYTDHVLSLARPRKVLMIAVDGVAPRAKMNQQRSRRFRSAQDARLVEDAKVQALQEAEARGEIIDDAIKGKKAWDTNVITPGTPFMDILAKSLRYWVAYKLNTDPGWKDLNVIISDASVPGEGEHKIMEFIRSQRSHPAHNPNTTHCIYGLDADLIFLGLATHEPHFKILREDVFAQDQRKRSRNRQIAVTEEQRQAEEVEREMSNKNVTPFLWLHLDVLRQYLEIELMVYNLPFPYDFERAIDDWVFMCFFCGNDFLPHMPSLDVRDNSIDLLTSLWKRALPTMGGYVSCDGKVNLARAEALMRALGNQEDAIFAKKRFEEVRRLENERKRKREQQQRKKQALPSNVSKNRGEKGPLAPLESMPLYTTSGESVGATHMSNSDIVSKRVQLDESNREAAERLKQELMGGSTTNVKEPVDDNSAHPSTDGPAIVVPEKRKAEDDTPTENDDVKVEEPADNVRTWEPGYRDRYYLNKFNVGPDDKEFRKEMVRKYIEGICWTLLYYYQGCHSWTWFYPYHYAPFAQDIVNIGEYDFTFDSGKPFRPFEQLMSVLPADSSHTLPKQFRSLMSDPDSEIIDFYPVEFPIDMNGKKMSWQGVALLPFIDEQRLLAAVHKIYPELTELELARNSRKEPVILAHQDGKFYNAVDEKLIQPHDQDENHVTADVRASETNGVTGTVRLNGVTRLPGIFLKYPLNDGDFIDLQTDRTVTLEFEMPHIEGMVHKSMILSGTNFTDPVLTSEDKHKISEQSRGRGGPRYNNRDKEPQYRGKVVPIGKKSHRWGGFLAFAERESQPPQGQYQNQGNARYGSDDRHRQNNRHHNQYENGGSRGDSYSRYEQRYGGYQQQNQRQKQYRDYDRNYDRNNSGQQGWNQHIGGSYSSPHSNRGYNDGMASRHDQYQSHSFNKGHVPSPRREHYHPPRGN